MKNSKPAKDKTLKQFLIKRFIVIILFVALSEAVISFVFSKFLFPYISKLLVYSDIEITNWSSGLASNIGQVILILIAMCILSFFPDFISDAVTAVFQQYSFDVLQIRFSTKFPAEIGSPLLEQCYYIGLMMLLFLLLFLLVLPYLIAAIAFGGMVSKKVEGPLHFLTNAMKQVTEGKLEVRLQFETEHEFIQMRDTFNEMACQMEAGTKEKKEFEKRRNLMLSDITHDLKTPITTISGYATALLEGVIEDPAQEKQFLEAIRAKSLRMDELIMLLSEYVKLDSDGYSLSRTPLDVTELLRENIAMLYPDFEAKNMDVEMDIPEEAVIYEIDQLQFSRVIANLLNNAIRYNKEGSHVMVKLKIDKELSIMIADDGDKISEAVAEHIFEPFVTGDESRTARSGSGLGLSIAKKIVNMHGGELILSDMKNIEYMEDTKNAKNTSYSKAFIITLPV